MTPCRPAILRIERTLEQMATAVAPRPSRLYGAYGPIVTAQSFGPIPGGRERSGAFSPKSWCNKVDSAGA
jgi:hypothetical protein